MLRIVGFCVCLRACRVVQPRKRVRTVLLFMEKVAALGGATCRWLPRTNVSDGLDISRVCRYFCVSKSLLSRVKNGSKGVFIALATNNSKPLHYFLIISHFSFLISQHNNKIPPSFSFRLPATTTLNARSTFSIPPTVTASYSAFFSPSPSAVSAFSSDCATFASFSLAASILCANAQATPYGSTTCPILCP